MERGNLMRAEKVPGPDGLLNEQIERKDCGAAAGRRMSEVLETDALAAQIGMRKLVLRRQGLAGVGDAVRESGLLRGKQQKRQQT